MENKTLSIAILGSRGIPNRYGGFEACAEAISTRLVEKGHKVSVYTVREHEFREEYWNGVRRILLSDPSKSLGTFGQFIYDLKCNRNSRKTNFDIILHLGYTSDSIWYWIWDKTSTHIVNMDGQEWKRAKYNSIVKTFLRYAEQLAALHSKWLVADSREIEKYLKDRYSVPVRYIAYGARIPQDFSPRILSQWNLVPGEYDLMVARMEPENNIEATIMAKIAASDNIPMVIVGNENKYKKSLEKKYAETEIIRFSKAVYEAEKIDSLRHFSRLYIHGHSVGGTNPSLLEAMACGCSIVSHRNPFNEAVLGEKAFYFSSCEDLVVYFDHYEAYQFKEMIRRNLEKVREEYNWDRVTNEYEKLFFDAIGAE